VKWGFHDVAVLRAGVAGPAGPGRVRCAAGLWLRYCSIVGALFRAARAATSCGSRRRAHGPVADRGNRRPGLQNCAPGSQSEDPEIEANGEATLAARVEALSTSKREVEGRLAHIFENFSTLEALRRDIGGIFTTIRNTLNRIG
jgi:hypothetical protein